MKPMRLNEVKKLLEQNGFELIRSGKGNHDIYRNRNNGKSIALTTSHIRDVSPGIMRQIKKLGIDF